MSFSVPRVPASLRYCRPPQAELQTAQLALAQYQTDLASNEQKVQALTSYLAQVRGQAAQAGGGG